MAENLVLCIEMLKENLFVMSSYPVLLAIYGLMKRTIPALRHLQIQYTRVFLLK